MTRLLLVAAGGALGSVARYGVGTWSVRALGTGLPWGTLLVNVVGSFVIALVMHLALTGTSISPELRLFLTTGVLGGFTTYSSFNAETLAYLVQGKWGTGAAYLAATVLGCLLSGFLGLAAGRALPSGA